MMEKQIAILDMAERSVPRAWEACINAALSAKIAVEEEIEKAKNSHVGPILLTSTELLSMPTICVCHQTDHIQRTFDYEPFIKEFITCMHNEGILEAVLEDDLNRQAEKEPKGKGTNKS